MIFQKLQPAPSAACGAWINDELTGDFGSVTRHVPNRFEAYVRIFHPPRDESGNYLQWADAAKCAGKVAHPLMQWHSVIGASDPDDADLVWRGSPPRKGDLDPHELSKLIEILAPFSNGADTCFFGLWTGQTWFGFRVMKNGPTLQERRKSRDQMDRLDRATMSVRELAAPRVNLPGREYVLMTGPLSAADSPLRPEPLDLFAMHSPNLMWPSDRAWFASSEVDFDSTLIGGSSDLVKAILQDGRLEAARVDPDGSLAYDGDHIN